MGLRIKSVTQVFNSLVTWITTGTDKLTDFTVGSALRTLCEAIALQIEEFYFDMRQNVEYAIQSAIYSAFGFDLIQGNAATGTLTVYFTDPLKKDTILPVGMVFAGVKANGKVVYFQSVQDTYVYEGASEALVLVQCTEIGKVGNVEMNLITIKSSCPSIIDSVTNAQAITNGVDEETAAERKARFKEYIDSLARCTANAIAYGIKQVEGVGSVWVDDTYIGYVRVYVCDSRGGLSDELKAAVEKEVVEWRAAGIEVEIMSAITIPQDLEITLIVPDTLVINDYLTKWYATVTEYLNNFTVSQNFYVSDLVTLLKTIYGDLIITMDIKGSNHITDNFEKIIAGNVTINPIYLSDWRS